MNNNIVIALVILSLLGTTGAIYLYTFRWRAQARTELLLARAESRKRQTSSPQAQAQTQTQSQSQAQAQGQSPQVREVVVRVASRAPSRDPSSRSTRPLLPPPPPPPASTTSRQEKRGRSRSSDHQDPNANANANQPQGPPDPPPRNQTTMSKRQQKKERRRQQLPQKQQQEQEQQQDTTTEWNADDPHPFGDWGDNSAAQKNGSSNQAGSTDWGGAQDQANEARTMGQQDEQAGTGLDSAWGASVEAVAGSPWGVTGGQTDWGALGDDGGQQGGWHADDAMEHKGEQEERDTGGRKSEW